MRKEKSILLGILIVLTMVITGCKKEIEDPEVHYIVQIRNVDGVQTLSEPYKVTAKQVIEFYNQGTADFYSYFSGKPGNVWAEYSDPSDLTTVGEDTDEKGNFSVTYQTPGKYTLTVVFTNRKSKNPSDFKQATQNFEIEVIAPLAN